MKRFSFYLCIVVGVLTLGCLFGCTPSQYSLTITAGGGGATDPAPGTYTHGKGTSVSVTATANAGFTFGHWEGDASGSGNPVTVIMDTDKSLAAVFMAQSEGEGETVEGEVVEGEVTAEGEGEATEGEVTVEGEGEAAEGERIEGEGEGETQRDVGILIDTYMGAESFATNTSPNPIDGRVMVFDSGAMPTTLHWVVKNGAGETNGDLSVDTAGAWSATLALAEGDNLLTLTVPDTLATKTLNLTYTPGYAFGEPLYVTPDVAYLNEDREFTALITLADPNTNPADVKLLRFDGGTGTEIASLADTGDTANGDELAGDGIYACKFHLNETAEGTLPLRVRAGIAGGTGSALSEAAEIMVTRHWTDEEMNAMALQIHNYQDQLRSATTADEMKSVCEQAANELKNDTNVADCGLNPDSWGMWVEYKNGYRAGLAPIVPGYRSGSSTAKAATPGLLSLAKRTSPYQKYTGRFARSTAKIVKPNHPVGSRRVYFLNSYANDFSGFEIDITNKLKDYGLDTTGMPIRHLHKIMEHTGVDQYYGLGSYGIVDLNTHGTLWGKKESPTVILCSGEYTERETWFFSDGTPTPGPDVREDELKTGELVDLGGDYGITPKFIRRNSGWFPKSLVLANACYSAYNSSMAQAFFDRGAGAYLGYSKPAGQFCADMDNKLLDTLLASSDNTLADAFVSGQFDPYPGPLNPYGSTNRAERAEYRMFGDSALSLPPPIVDGGFENSSLGQAWQVAGDARRIGVFGTVEFPLEGKGMALLKPGSSISQEFVYSPHMNGLFLRKRRYFQWTGICCNPRPWVWGGLVVRVEDVANPDSNLEVQLYGNEYMGKSESAEKYFLPSPLLFGDCTCECDIPQPAAIEPTWGEFSLPLDPTFGTDLDKKKTLRLTFRGEERNGTLCEAFFLDSVRLGPLP